MLNPNALSLLQLHAQQLATAGRTADAEHAYEQVLTHHPEDVSALNYLAVCALARDKLGRALELVQRAIHLEPNDRTSCKNLALILIQLRRLAEAEQVLQILLDTDPEFFVARLYLGLAQELAQKHQHALVSYFQAVSKAQQSGYWLSDESTPVGLREPVGRATRYLRQGRRRVLRAVMQPLLDRYGQDAMKRVGKAIAGYLGELPVHPSDPRQRPTFLYFPDLPAPPYFERCLFPWIDALEAATPLLQQELLGVLEEKELMLPFLGEPTAGSAPSYLAGARADSTAVWDGFFFHRHGKRFENNCARCPVTAEALDATTLVRIAGHAPEALYSVLGPGSHILPHTGVTNTRVVTHLPLLVPEDCALTVAGQRHAWQPGKCINFDDTYEHEAWNRSKQTRVVLLFDVWNPYLHEEERLAITDLVTAIAELNGSAVLAE